MTTYIPPAPTAGKQAFHLLFLVSRANYETFFSSSFDIRTYLFFSEVIGF